MQKCGDKFCSNPVIKLDFDVRNCVAMKTEKRPGWKVACFWQRDGAGCEECGGKTVRASSCSHCLACGWSVCG